MIQEKLENDIYKKVSDTGRNVELIVMNPKTWRELLEEVLGEGTTTINMFQEDMKYRGIQVIRSFDLSDYDFIIL